MKFIEIVIPTYNEEDFIADCLSTVLNFTVPKDITIKINVVDGCSTDQTAAIVNSFIQKSSNIFITKNEKRTQAFGLNQAIKKSEADFIMRLDAHSHYPKDYLIRCYDVMEKTNADNVGGILITLPNGNSLGARIVQSISSHWFGVGNSKFRTGHFSGKVDTVPFGFFKRQTFKKFGLFNVELMRGQDYEFNRRIEMNGGVIWMDSTIKATYFNQKSFIAFLKKQYKKEGPYNAYMWKIAPYSFAPRHAITLLFVSGLILGPAFSLIHEFFTILYISALLLYSCLAILASVQQSIKQKSLLMSMVLPFCFFGFHFSHGVGVLTGVLNIALGGFKTRQSK